MHTTATKEGEVHTMLGCCAGFYAHKATCPNHRHTFDGPRDCATCQALEAERLMPEWIRRKNAGHLPAKELTR
jgi:hypothetical protein